MGNFVRYSQHIQNLLSSAVTAQSRAQRRSRAQIPWRPLRSEIGGKVMIDLFIAFLGLFAALVC